MIARKSVLIMTTKLLDGGLGYLGLFFIARYMNPADYGIVSFAMGFVTLFTIFTNLGYPSAHIKRISEGKELGRCIGTFLSIRAVLLILATIILLASLFIWTNVLGRGFESAEHLAAIYIITGFWLAQEIVATFSGTFRARKEIAKLQIPFLINGIVRTIAIIYVALSGYGALALAWTYVAGELGNLLFTLWFFKESPIKRPTKEYLKNYTMFALPLAVVSASSIIMSNIDRVLIQLFWNSEDVGYYFAAYRLSHFINLATASIGMLIFPTFSKMHSNGAMDQIKKLLRDAERHLSLIVFPMVFGLIVLSEPVAYILLSGWMPAAGIIQILTLYALFLSLALPYEAQFNGMNKPKINRDRILIMVVCNVILNILLIPKDIQSLGGIQLFGLGARGAAIATVISYAISLIYTRIRSYQILGDKGNPRILIHALAAGAMSAILYLMLYSFNMLSLITRWYHLLAFGAFGLVIYLGILVLFKEFTKDDLFFYIDALNIRKMGQYISEELKMK